MAPKRKIGKWDGGEKKVRNGLREGSKNPRTEDRDMGREGDKGGEGDQREMVWME